MAILLNEEAGGDGEMGRWGDGEMGRRGDAETRRRGDAPELKSHENLVHQ
ncbi:MAG: hypothetical protein F6K31_03280 [Symploca sp. SIO2G7]|nr:hypothetical protein [Symploca sp. SIO2G7]